MYTKFFKKFDCIEGCKAVVMNDAIGCIGVFTNDDKKYVAVGILNRIEELGSITYYHMDNGKVPYTNFSPLSSQELKEMVYKPNFEIIGITHDLSTFSGEKIYKVGSFCEKIGNYDK